MTLEALSVPDESEPLPAVNAAAKQARPPVCKIAGKVNADGVSAVSLQQEPGALLRVLGDRSDEEAAIGETLDAGPYALSALNDVLMIALAGQKLTPGTKLPTDRANAMLQAMAAFEPQDELEGMIAAQATALHFAFMESLRRGLSASNDAARQSGLGQANKCSRTFAVLIETLNRHRGKTTTQRVIVENVNVQAGGQAVVGAVAGAGVRPKQGVQTHANTERGAGSAGESAQRSKVRSADALGEVLPPSGGDGAQALPDAWRGGRDRSAEGQSKPMGSRPLQCVGNGSAADDPGADPAGARSDGVTECEQQDASAKIAERK